MGFFTQQMGIPAPLAFSASRAEFIGGLGLIFGLITQIVTLGIAINMLASIMTMHLPNGLFMTWSGTREGKGFEFHLLAIALVIGAIAKRTGAFSLDHLLWCRPATK